MSKFENVNSKTERKQTTVEWHEPPYEYVGVGCRDLAEVEINLKAKSRNFACKRGEMR